MKKLYLKIIIFNILWAAIAFYAQAQRSNGLTVEGKVTTEEGSVDGAVIQMFRDGQRIDDYGIGSNGRYKVELNYNHKFELIFIRDGNFSQKIAVNAEVSQKVLQSDPSFPPFSVDINLYTVVPGIDDSFSENTILKIFYSKDVDNFISERYYNNAQIKNLIDQAILQSQMINKEVDYLAKLTKAELAELKKEYKQLLDGAEKDYSAEKFLDALDGYEAAGRVFPNEQYPKDRIAEINDLLGLLMVAEDMNQARQARLETLLKEADLQYSMLQYPEARNLYNRALSIDSDNQHAKQRVDEINNLLRQQQIEKDFKTVVALADNAFNEMLYEEALNKFNEALTLKQNESYPKQKINEINSILAKQTKTLENQESYKQAIFQAQLSFEKQFYDKALASYEQALSLKPGDILATDKIEEIKNLMQRLTNQTLYDKYIKSADKEYDKQRYAEALADYEKAFELLPDEPHARNQIALIRQQLDGEENFANWIKQADLAFDGKNYLESKKLYSQALEIHSDDKHALARLEEINQIFAGQEVDERYNTLVAEADQLFNEVNYNNAISKYEEALSVKANERYPKQKISEINSILADIEKANERYRQKITQGDKLFIQKNLDDAKTAFQDASTLKPEENYPQEMIAKIDSAKEEQVRQLADQQAAEQARLAALQREKDSLYNAAIARADEWFNGKEYETARNEYRSALDVKPEETYPQQQIDEIGNVLAQLSAAQKAYEEAISKADREFRNESFDAAINTYNSAKQAKSDETYPDEMLARIDSIVETRARLAAEAEAAEQARLVALQREKDSLYNAAIARADKLFNGKEYETARNEYRSALDVKPEETYPQQRIDEIGNVLAQLSAAQKAYEEAISKADREFRNETFDAAIIAYNSAKQVKSDETYPNEMLAKIDSIVETRARLAAEAEAAEQARLVALQREKDSLYNAAIARADKLFNGKEYETARNEYRSALDVKPEETYPQQQIDEIGNALAQLSAAQKAYEEAIAQADREFRREVFDAAISAYNSAKQAKSDETYPDEMLAKIDSIVEARARLAAEAEAAEQARLVALQREKDSLYNAAIARADKLFNGKEYETARNEYRSALDVKPEETYPQQRIDEIGNVLAQLSAAQKAYEEAISKADREFRNETFDAAIIAYNSAKQVKSDETYPNEMLAKIDSIVETRARLAAETEAAEQARLAALQREKDSLYNAAIARADEWFNGKEYETARNEYRSALDVKPEETYPQQQIDEIGNALAQLSAAQKAYEEAIAQADREFRREVFDAAISAYNSAKQAKSDETYPDEMLAKIDSIVEARARLAAETEAAEQARLAALQREKDSLYNAAIARADEWFNGKEYETARNEYRSALDVKPEETYPQQQIDEIGNALAQLSAAQKAYEEAIAQADREFRREVFDAAISAYNSAKQAKSDETYPDEMLAKIDSIVEARARLAAETEAAEQARLAALQREKDSLYNAAIARADKLFNGKEYETARNEYRSALDVKPEETYPQQQIDEIGNALAQLSAAQKAYEEAISKADREFRNETFDAAIIAYNTAKQAKSDATYPDEMLAKIDSIVETRARLAAETEAAEQARLAALQREKDSLYNAAIARADKLFNGKEYETARNEYRSALDVKPEETYPQQQIDEIGNALAQLSAAQKAYEEAISKADREFRNETFDAAIIAYNSAKQAMSDETYPDEMLAKIDSIVETRARLAAEAEAAEQARLAALQREKDSLYNAAIARADKLFNGKEYETARNEYRSALDVKPEETYPQQRIDEIENILAQLLTKQKELEILNKNYETAIQTADRYFGSKNYDLAKINYIKAVEFKPEEAYPIKQISEIDRLIQEQKFDEEYRKIVLAADGYFNTKLYDEAKKEYENALGLKPDEQYPKNQINKINAIFEDQQKQLTLQQKEEENLEKRRQEIQQQQASINEQQIFSEAELTNLYDEYITMADETFNSKFYNVARAWYYRALNVKPEESYPKQRINEINQLVKGLLLSQRDRDYQNYVDLGDSTFRNNQLAVARGWYNQALNLKPGENYPKEQLDAITNRIAERMAGQSGQLFESHVEKANDAFETKNYNVARFWYKQALALRPNENTVINRLKEIEHLLK